LRQATLYKKIGKRNLSFIYKNKEINIYVYN